MAKKSKHKKRLIKQKPPVAKSKVEDNSPLVFPTQIPQEQPQLTNSQKEIRSGRQILLMLSKDFIISIFIIVLGEAIHTLLKNVLSDPKILDMIPIRYVFELANVTFICVFVIIQIREIWKIGGKDEVSKPK